MTGEPGDPPDADGPGDARLLQRWREGDRDAGDELIARHFAMIYRFFASKLRDEATDLTQKTFAKAVEAVDTIQSLSSFRAYLMAIARNVLYSHLRGRSGWQSQIEPIATSLPAPGTSPSHAAAREQMRSVIGASLRRLPLDLQIMLEIHYWEGLTLREIAEVVGVPEGTVKSRMNRAVNLLRGHVDELLRQQGLPVSSPAGDLDAWSDGLRGLFGASDTPA